MYASNVMLTNTHYIPQYVRGDLPATVPFPVNVYYYKGGSLSGEPRYTPGQTRTTYVNRKWFWKNPMVWIKCSWWHISSGGIYEVRGKVTDRAGSAEIEASADEFDSPDEDCHNWYESEGDPEETACATRSPGGGYIGGSGDTEDEECYEVWYVWYDPLYDLYYEDYSGYDLCFRNGLMT